MAKYRSRTLHGAALLGVLNRYMRYNKGGKPSKKSPPSRAVSTKIPQKKSSSYTKTSTKKKPKRLIKSPPTGFSNSRTMIKYKQKLSGKVLKALSEPFVCENVDSFYLVSDIGQQTADVIKYHCLDSSSAINAEVYPMRIMLNNALAWFNNVPNSAGPPFYQAKQKSFKMYISSVTSVFQFMNQGAATVFVDIYDLVAKNSSAALTDPFGLWQAGITDQQVSGTAVFAGFPYAGLTASKAFICGWKVFSKETVEIGPGRGHQHTFTHVVNRLIDSEYFTQFNQIKGITTSVFCVSKGVPVDDSTSYTVGNISLSKSKVIGTVRTKYNIRMASVFPRHYEQTNNLPTTLSKANTFEEGLGAVIDTSAIVA